MNNELMKQTSKKAEKLVKELDKRIENGEVENIIDESVNWWYTANKDGEYQSVSLLFELEDNMYTVDTNEGCLSFYENGVLAQWDLSVESRDDLNKAVINRLKDKCLLK